MEHPLPVKSGGSQAPPWPRSSRNQDLRIYGMQYGTNLPNEPESYFSHLSCNYLSIIKLHKKYRGNNTGSFRRNACFRAPSSGYKQHSFLSCQRTTTTITHPATCCPAQLSLYDTYLSRQFVATLFCSFLAALSAV